MQQVAGSKVAAIFSACRQHVGLRVSRCRTPYCPSSVLRQEVADRLLDKGRVRVLTEEESALASLILGSEDLQELAGREDVLQW